MKVLEPGSEHGWACRYGCVACGAVLLVEEKDVEAAVDVDTRGNPHAVFECGSCHEIVELVGVELPDHVWKRALSDLADRERAA